MFHILVVIRTGTWCIAVVFGTVDLLLGILYQRRCILIDLKSQICCICRLYKSIFRQANVIDNVLLISIMPLNVHTLSVFLFDPHTVKCVCLSVFLRNIQLNLIRILLFHTPMLLVSSRHINCICTYTCYQFIQFHFELIFCDKRMKAIIRTNARILLIRPLGTNFSGFLVESLIFSFKKMR